MAVTAESAEQARWRARSLWLDTLGEPLAPRPPLPGDLDCDVVVVGAGFIGLWTAHSLITADPSLRIVVLEAQVAGYGAAGRNAGFVSAGISGQASVYARRGGAAGVVRAERAMIDAIDEVGRVLAEEGIDCGWVKGGSLRVATSRAQLERLRAGLRARRARAISERDIWEVTSAEVWERVRIPGVLGRRVHSALCPRAPGSPGAGTGGGLRPARCADPRTHPGPARRRGCGAV